MKKLSIFGVPRSGTSWLSQIFNSHPSVVMRFQPLFSYAHKGQINENATCEEINDFFADILVSNDKFATMSSPIHKNYPQFKKSDTKTHIIFKETRYLNIIENMIKKCEDIKVVGIVRDPFATLNSWISVPKEFHVDWDLYKEWRYAEKKNKGKPEEFFGFEKWKKAAKIFIAAKSNFPDRFFLLKYNDLLQKTNKTVSELFDFSGLDIDSQVSDFLKMSRLRHDEDPYSVFRSKSNDDAWKDKLPIEIVEKIKKDLNDENLNIFCNGI